MAIWVGREGGRGAAGWKIVLVTNVYFGKTHTVNVVETLVPQLV